MRCFYFNSSMVRLKGGQPLNKGEEVLNFNSSMVRLKDLCPLYYLNHNLFQFQYGAIKSPLLLRVYDM